MALSKILPASRDQSVDAANLIINGAMQVAQRSTSLTVGDSTEYKTLDRWAIGINGTTAGRATMSQSTDAPNDFGNSMKFDVTTADTSIGASEAFGFLQRIEGQNLQQLAKGTADANACTLSFYAKGTAKTYVVETRDANSRQVSATFSVTSSWQRFEIEIPADTSGTITNSNATGLTIIWWLHAGSDYTSGTLNTSWAASVNANRMVGCDSLFSAVSNTLQITGVCLNVGDQAPANYPHRGYGEELALCQRYFIRYYGNDTPSFPRWYNPAYTAGCYMGGQFLFPVQMRSAPSLTFSLTFQNATASGTGSVSRDGMVLFCQSTSATTISGAYIDNNGSDHITADAEL